jgi:ketosteroid isomerase-like protein
MATLAYANGTRENAHIYENKNFASCHCLAGSLGFGICCRASQAEYWVGHNPWTRGQWNAAYDRGDIATMNTLLADDFIITVEDGSTFSKSGYIAHYGDSTVHVEISDMSDLKVRMHGKTAVVTGAYHEKGTSKGKPYEYRDRFTDVWMNLNGPWQVIASHYSIPASP